MSFTWNTFGWINLGIDLLAVLLSLGAVFYALRRWNPDARFTFVTFKICVRALVVALCGWLPVIGYIGGIVGFSLMARLGWTTATVTIPLVCLYLARSRRMPWLAVVAIALVAVKYYGEVWEPSNLEVERVEVRLPGLKRKVKLVHLSDLQTDMIGPLHERISSPATSMGASRPKGCYGVPVSKCSMAGVRLSRLRGRSSRCWASIYGTGESRATSLA